MMSQTKTKSKLEKIKLFQILADQDGNYSLSYDEIFELAKDSIGSIFRFDEKKFNEDQFYDDLCEYFTKFIFEICKTDLSKEISIYDFQNAILENKKH